MNDNVYAAPQAQLIDPQTSRPASDPFYVVSTLKFNFLFYLTMGFYSIYWFYRHWKAWKRHTGRDLWPVPRSIFSIFFVHSLFALFEKTRNPIVARKGDFWASLFVVAAIFENIASRFAGDDLGWGDLVSLGCLIPIGISLSWGQKVANSACLDSDGSRNAHFSIANILWMVFGGLFWLLVLSVLALTMLDTGVPVIQ